MRKAWWLSATAALTLGLAAAVVSRTLNNEALPWGKKAKPPEVTLEFAPSEVVQPAWTPLAGRIEFSGPLVAPNTAIVRSKATGTLLALSVAEGSRVRTGQSLGRIDLADMASRIAERQAQLEAAQAQHAQAVRTHAANRGLADQRFISPNALESSNVALEAARAQVQTARAQLNTARLGMRDAALVAPIGGVVSKRHVVPGEKLSIEQPVVTIVDLATLELAGSVGTHEVSQLEPGLPVEVRIEGVAQPVAGTVSRIAPAAEAGTRSIGVMIELANPREAYRAGQYALARVAFADAMPRFTLPSSAIVSSAGQEQVWVLEHGVLLRRAVTTGRRDAEQGRVEVLSGVASNAQVLAVRFDNLKEGAKAIVSAPSANPASVAGKRAPSTAR